jgi:type IV fimbrial biogenesis protein FimT
MPVSAPVRARPARGFTLIELLAALVVLMLLLTAGTPALSEFLLARRLSAGADVLFASAVFARSEAIKRNATVLLEVDGSAVRVAQDDAAHTPIRSAALPAGLTVAPATLRFGAHGRTRPDGAALELAPAPAGGCVASESLQCPRVRINAGGRIDVCRTASCP